MDLHPGRRAGPDVPPRGRRRSGCVLASWKGPSSSTSRTTSDVGGQRETRAQAGALARSAVDLQGAADRGSALAHGLQPQVSRKLTARVEPPPIVCYHQPHLAISQLQVQVERVVAGMFDRVV